MEQPSATGHKKTASQNSPVKLVPVENKTRILIIDDEKEACKLIREFFESMNYQVNYAHDGEEGLNLYKSFKPNIVLLDIRMPKLNGLAFLDKMDQQIPKCHVLVATGAQDKNLYERCRDKGADDFFTKPVNLQEIQTKIAELL